MISRRDIDSILPPDLITGLAQGEPVMILAGAGLSAASGVPTFREAQTGLWAQYRPEDLATPEAFAADSQTVWKWYAWRREQIRKVEPNAAHDALARWQRHADVTIVTQNVDGLQQRSGSKRVIEFHGNLFVNKCFNDDRVLDDADLLPGTPPVCRHCGGFVRPGVVWFGESIPDAAMAAAQQAVDACRWFVSVGTSSLVYPAAAFAEQALRNGARVIEINPDDTPLSTLADYRFAGLAHEILPPLVDAVLAVAESQEATGRNA